MTGLRPIGRRGRALAATLAVAAGMAACGRGQVPAAQYDPDAPKETPAPAPPADAAPTPPAAAAAAPTAAPLTPEQDSAQEARAFARRQQSMESYESCVAKVRGIEEPIRTALIEACGRSRTRGGKP